MDISEQVFNELINLINKLIKKINEQDNKINKLIELIKCSNLIIDDSVSLKLKKTVEAGEKLLLNGQLFELPNNIIDIINYLKTKYPED